MTASVSLLSQIVSYSGPSYGQNCTRMVLRSSMVSLVFQVVCTGTEERLLDCDFPQDFGADYVNSYDYAYRNAAGSDYNGPEPPPLDYAHPGLPNSGCDRSDIRRLGVICRRFEVKGASVLSGTGTAGTAGPAP